jgi:branched-chain amino acid transport system ATP-binding protein
MPILEVQDLVKDFGGLRANNHISFSVEKGELLGLIGPNGAGKSTLFNCIAGVHQVTAGKILFEGKDITNHRSYEICRLGLARTFQIFTSSGDLTVIENVMVGSFLKTRSRQTAKKKSEAILDFMGLSGLEDQWVSELPVAAQKRVAMATALATQPRLLLLDEVAAGLNPTEIEQTIGVIRQIHFDMGVTVVLIEHVMELVMNLSQRVIVLDSGTLIAEGKPENIKQNPEVIKAYLGERYASQVTAGGEKI